MASDYDYTYGGVASEMLADYGMVLDPWQSLIMDDWLAVDEDGRYVHPTCGLSVPRQNGKNGSLEGREVYGMTVEGEKILHTAHEVKTARKHFERMLHYFDNERDCPDLYEQVKTIRRTNGQEGIFLKDVWDEDEECWKPGGSIEFSARSKGAARGFTVDLVVCDEAQELTDEQLNALLPTKSAAPLGNSQLILTGTPPDVSSSGDVFQRTRDKALAGKSTATSWIEWSVDSIGDVYDERRWEETNPALGFRLTREAVEAELDSMSDDGFARERLGWWMEGVQNAVFDMKKWDPLKTSFTDGQKAEQRSWKRAFGVKFSADGATVSLAVAIQSPDYRRHVEVIEHRSMRDGIAWIADFLEDVWRTAALVVVDGVSNAQELCDELAGRKVSRKAICKASSANAQAAASTFISAVNEGKLSHLGQPALDAAVRNAQKRTIGSGGGFGFKGAADTDVSPLEAVSLALWGVKTSKRNPARKLRIG